MDVELSIQFNENESRAARIEGAKGAIAVRHPITQEIKKTRLITMRSQPNCFEVVVVVVVFVVIFVVVVVVLNVDVVRN